jgi:hypothetical protein
MMARHKRWQRAGFVLALLLQAVASSSAAGGVAGESASESVGAAADNADAATASPPGGKQSLVVVVGAPGADEYAAKFKSWAETWRLAAERAGAEFTLIGAERADGTDGQDDRARLEASLAAESKPGDAPLWIVLIGHGAYDGQSAKFNLRGPDATAEELAGWLAPIQRPVVLIDCASASAPLINAASAKGRIVITATKSGYELNYARFGEHLAEAIVDPAADLDKDDQTSLLEAYLTACRRTSEFYASEQRLATEHALLDDNGDGLGTPAAWFQGLRATQAAEDGAALDGLAAHQLHLVKSDREARMPPELRRRRDELEQSIESLRGEKSKLGEEAYYGRLEPLMLELARLYGGVDEGSEK